MLEIILETHQELEKIQQEILIVQDVKTQTLLQEVASLKKVKTLMINLRVLTCINDNTMISYSYEE